MKRVLFVAGVGGLLVSLLVASSGDRSGHAQGSLNFKLYLGQLARDEGLPTSTPIPTPPPSVPSPPSSPLGTRANPIPIGQTVSLGDGWSLRVVSVTPNATAQVLAKNQFNDPPRPGNQFFIARIAATYSGSGSDRFDGSFRLRAVGSSAVTRTTFEDSCGVIPDDLADPEVFSGGVVSGNVCWEIPSSDAAGMLVYDDPFLGETGVTFFSMIPPGQPVPAVPVAPPLAPVPPTGASRETAVPKGTLVPFAGGWNVRVLSVTPNATTAVLSENQFNDPPAAGRQFFIARVSATYVGEGHARFDGSFRIRVVGDSGVVFTTFSNSCGVIPDRLVDPKVFPAGTIVGNLCWEVPSSDASTLVALDRPFLMDPIPLFLSLAP